MKNISKITFFRLCLEKQKNSKDKKKKKVRKLCWILYVRSYFEKAEHQSHLGYMVLKRIVPS